MKLFFKYCFCFFFIAQISNAQTTSINSIEPNTGYAGQIISIKGLGFSGIDKVFFGSVAGTIVSVSDQLIEAEVPSGATFDNISILNSISGQTYYSGEDFFLSFGGEAGISAEDFDTQIDLGAGNGLFDITIADIDGDGKNDIVGANSKSDFPTIYRNLTMPGGTLSFIPTSPPLNTKTLNVTSGDLNGDGKPEIVFTQAENGNRLIILINNSIPANLNFLSKIITITGASTKRVVIKDLDLDGRPDLVVSDQATNKIYLLKNISTGSGGTPNFSTATTLNVENAATTLGLEVEDLNGDGKPEIITNQFITNGGGFYVATNQSNVGSLNFSAFNQFQTEGTFVNLKVADINGDKKPDIAATLFLSASTAIFLNETTEQGAAPSFSSANNLTTDINPWGLDFGDMDGDQLKDIAVATVGTGLAVNILNNNAANSVSFSNVKLPVTYINRNIRAADMDGDSKPDLIFTSVDDDNNGIAASKISILRNNKCILPIITSDGPLNACAPNVIRLETQKIAGISYEWEKDGSVVKTGSDNFIEISDPTASGSYTVTIISESGTCNETSEALNAVIGSATALPPAMISPISPVCIGGTLTLESNDLGAGVTYEWRGPNNYTATGISVTVENFNFDKVGKYFLDVYAGSCVVETKDVVAEVIAAPNFSVSQSGTGNYCEGDVVNLTVQPNDPDFNYQWYNGATAITGATGANFSPTASGSYYVEASDNINTFCPSISTNPIDLNIIEVPNAAFSFPTTACTGNAVSFTNSSTTSNGATANFVWNFGDGGTSTARNPSYTYNSAGVFDVTLSISYDGLSSCTAQITNQITINGALNVAINSSESSICLGDTITLSVNDTFDSYLWSTGETSPTINVSEEGIYTLSVFDANGCEGAGEISIAVFPLPEVEISASETIINQGDTVTITASGLLDYTWSPDSLIISSSGDLIQVVLNATTTISVEGLDANGCVGTNSINILVEESNIGDLLNPERFFSPNNDAIAQFWEIENIDNFQQCAVEIYDKVGNKVYEAKPYLNDWEGTSNGQAVPDGAYYYVIRCDNEGIVKTGSVTILR